MDFEKNRHCLFLAQLFNFDHQQSVPVFMLVAKKIGSAVLTFTKEYTILNYSYSMFTTGWKRVPFKNLRRFGSDVSQL